MIDLHCHSYYSDGALSPAELLKKAVDAGLNILALTDHDTMAGLPALHKAALNSSVKIINGIELSVRWKKYDIHIIGLHVQEENKNLQEIIMQQNENRIQRAQLIAERLVSYGIHDAYRKACELAGHERVNRPHFAQVLINEGLVPDMKAAFKRFLGQRRPAYVATAWLSLEEAVEAIINAGGDAIIAHPLKYKLTRIKLHELITSFKIAGGVGMEVVSGETSLKETEELASLCDRYELLASTGSDYHGDTLSRTALGQQRPLPVNCVPIWHQWNL